MEISSQKNSGAIAFIASIIVALAVGYFFTLPQFQSWSQKSKVYAEYKEEIATLEKQKQEVQQSISAMTQDSKRLETLNAAIPDSPDLPNLYSHLENLYTQAGLSMTSIQAVDATENPTEIQTNADGTPLVTGISNRLGVVNISLELHGNYNGVKQILGSIEQSLRILDIQSADLTASDLGGLILRLNIKSYYLKK